MYRRWTTAGQTKLGFGIGLRGADMLLLVLHINSPSGRKACIVSTAPGLVCSARGFGTLGPVQSLSQSDAELKADSL
ncbi:hypothetical protein Q8A67_020205 [Cirrhinus molitorella]|uniref:Uncharacterized protein n=1 Tax=Cirrhinus molitorella TaxID=172907 RepID=A0AA88TDT0_9TELE|nr:hypothetical protein Q8A67_020205 [Cirrhinus molitorella]